MKRTNLIWHGKTFGWKILFRIRNVVHRHNQTFFQDMPAVSLSPWKVNKYWMYVELDGFLTPPLYEWQRNRTKIKRKKYRKKSFFFVSKKRKKNPKTSHGYWKNLQSPFFAFWSFILWNSNLFFFFFIAEFDIWQNNWTNKFIQTDVFHFAVIIIVIGSVPFLLACLTDSHTIFAHTRYNDTTFAMPFIHCHPNLPPCFIFFCFFCLFRSFFNQEPSPFVYRSLQLRSTL